MIWSKDGYMLSHQLGPVVTMEDPLRPGGTRGIMNPMMTNVPEIGTFETYCISHFGADWISTIREAVEEERVPIGKVSRTVGTPTSRFVSDAEFIRVEFYRLDRKHFYADAVISVSIEVSAYRDGEWLRDTLGQWYRLRNLFTVDGNGGYWLETEEIYIYDKKGAFIGLPLSKYLVPVLKQEDIEEEAEALLQLYYPEGFMFPSAVDAEVLAQRMGLEVLDVALASDESLMGQSIFYDGEIEVIVDGEVVKRPVHAGTILVNSLSGMDDIQRTTTILHECCHHYEHDLFVWAQRLWQDDITGIRCPVVAGDGSDDGNSPLYWAERQARIMAYCVQLSRIQVERQAQLFIDKYENEIVFLDYGREMEETVHHIANTFRASRECARKRLVELGFYMMRGVLNYVNGGYIPPYFFPADVLTNRQTFVISFQDALAEYERNAAFRSIIEKGFYVYVEGKFCLNQPKFVETNSRGDLRMTEYGRWHTEECCLRFDMTFKGSKLSYTWGRFNREGRTTGSPANAAEPGLYDAGVFRETVEWATTTNRATAPMDFADALCYLMDERGISLEMLEEKSMLSSRTIKRLRGDPEYNVTREHIIALAVGLRLPPMVSMELMKKAGLLLKNTRQHNTYMMVLCTMYQADIHQVNSFLESQNISPLSKMGMAM